MCVCVCVCDVRGGGGEHAILPVRQGEKKKRVGNGGLMPRPILNDKKQINIINVIEFYNQYLLFFFIRLACGAGNDLQSISLPLTLPFPLLSYSFPHW